MKLLVVAFLKLTYWFALSALGVYIALAPVVSMNLYNSLLFHPADDQMPDPKTVSGCPVKVFDLPSGSNKIHTWYINRPGAGKTVLFAHGNGGNVRFWLSVYQNLLADGVSVITFDYPGFGRSTGTANIDNTIASAETVYDFARRQLHVAPENMIFFGASYGTGVAAQLAAHHASSGLVLVSPYQSMLCESQDVLPWLRLYPQWAFPKQFLDTKAALAARCTRLLIIHGLHDALISVNHARALYASASSPKRLIVLPDVAHDAFNPKDGAYWQSVLNKFLNGDPSWTDSTRCGAAA